MEKSAVGGRYPKDPLLDVASPTLIREAPSRIGNGVIRSSSTAISPVWKRVILEQPGQGGNEAESICGRDKERTEKTRLGSRVRTDTAA